MRRLLLVCGSICLMAAPASAQSGQASAPTFNKDVAPILFDKCIACHRPGEIAPMSLLTYKDARPWAKGIKAKVSAHEMPPWFADPKYGKFKNARGLSQTQIDTLIAWADAGAPEGTGPAPVATSNIGDSQAGTLAGFMDRAPDATILSPWKAEIPPTGDFTNWLIWGPPPFTEDKHIEAAELRPSNRVVTHHSQVGASPLPRGADHIGPGPAYKDGPFINAFPVHKDGTLLTDARGNALVGEQVEEATANVQGFNFATRLLFYAPGAGTLKYAPGLVKTIHKEDYMSWNIHYNPTGRPERDRHTLKLWFSRVPARAEIKSATINQVNMYEGKEIVGRSARRENIPANADNYEVSSNFSIGFDSTLNSLWPHMHLRGKDMTFSVTYPDGREEILLSVPKYDFNWQVIYALEEPIKIPAGSVLRAVAHYDNSKNNRFNPTPDQELPWGSQSWHEMYFPYFDLAIADEVQRMRDSRADCADSHGCVRNDDHLERETPNRR